MIADKTRDNWLMSYVIDVSWRLFPPLVVEKVIATDEYINYREFLYGRTVLKSEFSP